jgi:hypothetical protein
MLPSVIDSSPKSSKSFWERPEGLTGMITIGLLGLGGFFLAQSVLPALLGLFTMGVAVVGKGIVLTILCAVLAALLYVLTNKQFLTLVSYMFKSGMRKVTQLFVETDPIGIMKGYIETLTGKKSDIDEKKTKLKGQLNVIDNAIDNNAENAEKAMNMMAAAKKTNQPKELTYWSREHGRLVESNKTLGNTSAKMTMLYNAVQKYAEACDFVIRDIQSDVKIKEQERKALLGAHGAMASVMSILKGSGSEKELFDQAMDFVVEDYAQKMGEIDDFMLSTETILGGINLQNGMWEEKALKELEAWEAKSNSVLLGGEKRMLIENAGTTNTFMNFNPATKENVTVTGGDDFNKFFSNKS